MVKYLSVLLLVAAFAAPAFAADDVSQLEIGLGYGNINVGTSGRHSGFTSHQTINLNNWLGVENFVGYYGFGTDPTYGKAKLFADIFGGKVTYRAAKVAPYAIAGIGGGFLRFDSGVGTNNSLAVRFGGGVDIPIKDGLAWKVDVSRESFHFGGWTSGTSLSTGIVLKLGNF
jgi:hypothetical protein